MLWGGEWGEDFFFLRQFTEVQTWYLKSRFLCCVACHLDLLFHSAFDLLTSFLRGRPSFSINLQPEFLLKLCGVCINWIAERRRSQKPETLLVHILARPEDPRSSSPSVTASAGSGRGHAECGREECPSDCSLQVNNCCLWLLKASLRRVV